MRPPLRFSLVLLLAGFTSASAQVVTQIWGAGSGVWDTTTTNWSGAAWVEGNAATIGTSAARTGTVTVQSSGVSLSGVSSGSGGGAVYSHVLTGGSIALAAPAVTWSVGGPTGSQLLVESAITGAGAVEKTGTRLLILAGNNTYAGGTTISAGNLQIGNGGTSGSVAGNIIANATLTFNRSDTHAFSGIISGTGSVTQAGSGTLVFSGDNTYAGNTSITSGTLQLGTGGTTGSVAGNIANAAALVIDRSNTYSLGTVISGTGTLRLAGTGTTLLDGANTYTGATTVATGASLGGTGTLASAVTVENGGSLVLRSGQRLTVAGLTLSPTSNLNLALAAPSAQSLLLVNGNVTLAGTLNVTDAGGFGPGLYRLIDYTGTFADNGIAFGTTAGLASANFALQTSVANQVNLLLDAGPANLWRGGAGTWSATGNGWTDLAGVTNTTWQPNFAIFGGTAGVVAVDAVAGPVVLTGAQFATTGYSVTAGALTNNTPNAIFRVGNGTSGGATSTALIESVITGTGGLNKTDLGTLVLSGNNSYAGATTVTNGTLRVNGNQSAATGATAVLSGATLTGNGTIGGAVAVSNGGTLSGQAGATLKLGGLTLNNTSAINVALGAPSATGLFQVNGNLVLDGVLSVADAGGFGPGVYRLFDYSGSLTNNVLTFGTTPVNAQFLAIQSSIANQINLVFDSGPRNFWSGGAGVWTANPTSSLWSDFTGSAAAPWQPNFAIFQNTGGAVTVDAAGGAVVLTGMQFAANGYTVGGGILTNNTPAAVFRVGNGTSGGTAMAATISSVITGTGGLDKTDLGTLVLSGNNSYTGSTTVSGGTLRVNGNQSTATGSTTVRSGAALAGSGTLGGSATVENGATLVGQQGATLTMGALVLNDTSAINVTLGAPAATTLFQVNGNLTLDGILNITSSAGFGEGLYRLFNYTGTLTNNGLLLGNTAGIAVNSFSIQTATANQVSLLYRDLSVPLPIWGGGSGTWSADPDAGGFRNDAGTSTGGWRSGFAVLQGTPGTIAVSTAGGPIVVTGMQFAVNGYTVNGGTVTNNTPSATFRVGDGTAASATMTGTINSVIAGTGGLNKTDLGTLVLGGANTYSGGTTVSSGVLQVSTDSNLGAASGGLTFAGGTVRAGATLTSNRAVTIGAGGGTLDTVANTVTLSGAVTGTGALTKSGTGTLVLSGVNTNTGTTTVAGGTLRLLNSSIGAGTINAGATLAGDGTIRGNLTNGGRVSPGASPGTITINGNYTQSSTGTYAAELASATSFDRLIVTGAAALNGTLTVSSLGGYTPTIGQSFTLLSATGGVTGAFATVGTSWDAVGVMVRPTVSYTANEVRFALTQRAFASLNGTANQRAIGATIDNTISVNSAPTLRTALNALPTDAAVLSALDALSPLRYEHWFGQAVVQANAAVRTAELRLGEASASNDAGLWMEFTRRSTTFDARADSGAAEGTATGITVGGDVTITPNFRLGLMLSYDDETLELDAAGSSTETPRFGLSAYARQAWSNTFVDIVGGFSTANLASRRVVAIPGFANVATLENGSFESHVGLRLGYAIKSENAQITPYIGGQFVRWQANGTNETNASSANLALKTQTGKSLVGRVGVLLSGRVSAGDYLLTPELDLAWRNESEDAARDITGTLAGAPFAVRTRAPHASGLTASVGLRVARGERVAGFVRAALERDGQADEVVEASAGVTYRF